jgi:hypothetical protein
MVLNRAGGNLAFSDARRTAWIRRQKRRRLSDCRLRQRCLPEYLGVWERKVRAFVKETVGNLLINQLPN